MRLEKEISLSKPAYFKEKQTINPLNSFEDFFALQNALKERQEPKKILEDFKPNKEVLENILGEEPSYEAIKARTYDIATSFLQDEKRGIKLSNEEQNPFSYPRSFEVLKDLMEEKIDKYFAKNQKEDDEKLQLMLAYKQEFENFPKLMEELKEKATQKVELFASLAPDKLNSQKDIYFKRAQELQSSVAEFSIEAMGGIAFIDGFFGLIEKDLSLREKELLFTHAQTFQNYWYKQTGGEEGKFVLNNGMVYESNVGEGVGGFNLITQNLLYAYREKTLEDGTKQYVLAVYDKLAKEGEQLPKNIHPSIAATLDFSDRGYKLVGAVVQ
ncbi:hypothetical protein [Helicobacter burdigaliensis]|uniref:hypothetical protein n=1 Tax=Helicobacter burdigaliensis TaxID=2315334 RepID=UPI00130072CA|nr:hypothetical protein [Helicobacter burdigaliensis]